MRIIFKTGSNTHFVTWIQNFEQRLHKRIQKGHEEASTAYLKYIKDDLLTGKLLKERKGWLRRDLQLVIEETEPGKFRTYVKVKKRSAEVAQLMIEGRGSKDGGWGRPWQITGSPWLLFYWDVANKNMRLRTVNHKGYKARNFPKIAAEDMKARMREILRGRIAGRR